MGEESTAARALDEPNEDVIDVLSPADLPWGARLKMAERFHRNGDTPQALAWIGEPGEWMPHPEMRLRVARMLEESEPELAIATLSEIVGDKNADVSVQEEAHELLYRLCLRDGHEYDEDRFAAALAWRPPAPPVVYREQGKFAAILVAVLLHVIAAIILSRIFLPDNKSEDPLPLIAIGAPPPEEIKVKDRELSRSKTRPTSSAPGGNQRLVSTHAPAPFSVPSNTTPESMGLGFGETDGVGFGTSIGRGGQFPARGKGTNQLRGIKAKHLAVVLDVSGSMSPYLQGLTKEIARRFPDAVIVICPNSRLHRETSEAFTFTTGAKMNKYLKRFKDQSVEKRDIGSGILHVLKNTKCDAIYVMCDFQDGESDPDPIDEIVDLATHRKVALHLGLPTSVNIISNFAERKKRLRLLFDYARTSGSVRTKLD